jgi:hypothetical protein
VLPGRTRPPRDHRTGVVLSGIAVVLATTSGCGFLDAMAHPEAAQQTSAGTAPAGADPAGGPPAPAPATPTADYPAVIAQGTLAAADGGPGTPLTVTVGHVQTGLVLPFIEFAEDCPVDGPSLQYVPVTFDYDPGSDGTAGLAGHLTVTSGPGTPADIGNVGVCFEPASADPYCADYPPLPTTDTFWSRGSLHVDGYVVLDQAVTAVTPGGRDEVFPTLQARISNLRLRDYDGRERPLTVEQLTTGAPCADDQAAICVPLG